MSLTYAMQRTHPETTRWIEQMCARPVAALPILARGPSTGSGPHGASAGAERRPRHRRWQQPRRRCHRTTRPRMPLGRVSGYAPIEARAVCTCAATLRYQTNQRARRRHTNTKMGALFADTTHRRTLHDICPQRILSNPCADITCRVPQWAGAKEPQIADGH